MTTINTWGEKKPLTGLPGSCFHRASQAPFPSGGSAPDLRGCLQSSTWGEEGEQDNRRLNTALNWHWLPVRIQTRSPTANGCCERLILFSLSHPSALGTSLRGAQEDTTPRRYQQVCGSNILPVQAGRTAELALNLWCYKVSSFFIK